MVETFAANDQITYVLNENYREPTKPYFSSVLLKGGGDPASAARAVMQTGDYDFAWNLQVEPEIIAQTRGRWRPGHVLHLPRRARRDPSASTSPIRTPRSMASARRRTRRTRSSATSRCGRRSISPIQRDVIAERFYGEGQPPTANILTGLESFTSPNTTWSYDPDAAAQHPRRGRVDARWRCPGEGRGATGACGWRLR